MVNNIGIYDFPRNLIDLDTFRQPIIDDAPPELETKKNGKRRKHGKNVEKITKCRKAAKLKRKVNWIDFDILR